MTTRARAEALADELNTGTTGELARQVGRAFAAARGDVSLRDFAEKVGLAHGTLHQFERGRDNPTLARLERMAADYGVRLTITVEPLP